MLSGRIFNIQRLSVNDGPGIRTTIFLKGCPLNCLWCHNPESKANESELAYYRERCNVCRKCAEVCPSNCHEFCESKHIINRISCVLCGSCVSACPRSALEIIGKEITVNEIIAETLKDRKFYDNSDGGLTLSGGEPLYQPEFTLEILKHVKRKGLHTCVETSGFTEYNNLQQIIPYTDLFLYDWKETNDDLHRKFTSVSNKLIYQNLLKLDKVGAKTILRCPIIPSHNARQDHYLGIVELANQLKNIVEINILPYHTLGVSKCCSLGCAYSIQQLPPLSSMEKEACVSFIEGKTNVKVKA